MIDLCFPAFGERLAADHGYELYAALSRLLPRLHDELSVRIAPIRGDYAGQGTLQLKPPASHLRLRLSPDDIPQVLPLAGKSLVVGEHRIRLGVPQVRALVPAPNLIARLVVIKASSPRHTAGDRTSRDPAATKRYLEPAAFLDAVRRDLARRDIHGEADLPVHETGPRAGQPRRHVLRIHRRTIVGFSVIVQSLTAGESIRLMEEGLGGRGKMGGGFFVAMK